MNKEMALQNDERSKNLLCSQTHIWNHIFSFIKSMSLKCAIELQIPDIIDRHGSPMLLSELVEALPIDQQRTQYVYRLMRILVHCGFFVKQGEGYLLAPASRLLLKEDSLSHRPLLLAMLDPIFLDPWQHMTKWFQNEDVTPFHLTHGKGLWDVLGQEPRLGQLFNEAMANDARLIIGIVLERCGRVFEGLDSIVDVGGGTGTAAKAIAKTFPNVSCICFDVPHVVNGLVGSKNLSYVGGDMFGVLPNANAILLKNCKEAIQSKENGGKLVIIDMVMKVDEGVDELVESQLFFDMLMMTCITGRERTEKDWAKLFIDGGFSDYRITLVLGSRSVIEVYP
ncbi:trans-resveratrol di-O-methyltransferase-like isoform X2 [Bidens hawaiensis]|uniref:trans-resveratrol di-O-methyltransferase-like isoform X2 n=1 Tax=Bidens hawaiensis TaxID=980011 RepID=UPI004049C699